jgi:uncharacterized membrane-anchored protein YhcB (DUF1043 family)
MVMIVLTKDQHTILDLTASEAQLLQELLQAYAALYVRHLAQGGTPLSDELVRLHHDLVLQVPND